MTIASIPGLTISSVSTLVYGPAPAPTSEASPTIFTPGERWGLQPGGLAHEGNELEVHLTTARKLGITVPPTLLALALVGGAAAASPRAGRGRSSDQRAQHSSHGNAASQGGRRTSKSVTSAFRVRFFKFRKRRHHSESPAARGEFNEVSIAALNVGTARSRLR